MRSWGGAYLGVVGVEVGGDGDSRGCKIGVEKSENWGDERDVNIGKVWRLGELGEIGEAEK